MKAIAVLLTAALLVAVAGAEGFGEYAGQLNFTPSPGSSQSLGWGIMNTYSYPLQVKLSLTTLEGPSPAPLITIDPQNITLNATTVLNASVTVDAYGIEPGLWNGTLTASTPPQSNEPGMALISLATIKKFTIDTTCRSWQLVSQYTVIVGMPCTRVATKAQMMQAGIWKG